MVHLFGATGRVPVGARSLWVPAVPGVSGQRTEQSPPGAARCSGEVDGQTDGPPPARLHPRGPVRSALSPSTGGETETRKGPSTAFIPFQTCAEPSRTFSTLRPHRPPPQGCSRCWGRGHLSSDGGGGGRSPYRAGSTAPQTDSRARGSQRPHGVSGQPLQPELCSRSQARGARPALPAPHSARAHPSPRAPRPPLPTPPARPPPPTPHPAPAPPAPLGRGWTRAPP